MALGFGFTFWLWLWLWLQSSVFSLLCSSIPISPSAVPFNLRNCCLTVTATSTATATTTAIYRTIPLSRSGVYGSTPYSKPPPPPPPSPPPLPWCTVHLFPGLYLNHSVLIQSHKFSLNPSQPKKPASQPASYSLTHALLLNFPSFSLSNFFICSSINSHLSFSFSPFLSFFFFFFFFFSNLTCHSIGKV